MTGSVHIIGAGLIGASIGMALQAQGVRVTLEDLSPTTAALARDLGAGSLPAPADDAVGSVDIVIVATPPDVTSTIVVAAHPTADTGSVSVRKYRLAGDTLTMKVDWRGGILGLLYTSDIAVVFRQANGSFKIDSIDYEDDNPIAHSKKGIQELIRQVNSR